MGLLNKANAPLVGVDISSTAVKLLQLSRTPTGYRVEHYAVEPLPPNAVVEKQLADVEAVGETVRRAVERAGIRGRLAAAAVPGSSVISKVIQMASDLTDDEMEAQVESEAGNYIPYPIEEVNYDFEVLGPVPNAPATTQVLLVASRAENVEARQAALQLGGLEARVIDVEAFAIENAFGLIAPQLTVPRDALVALVDVGASTTTLNVLKNGRSEYLREQLFGGKQLTEEIMRRFGLSYEEAGRAKRLGGLPETYDLEVLEPFKDTLAQQVGRLLQFYYASSEHNRVDQVVLAGGCASIPGIAQVIEENLGIPTIIANPLAQMTLDKRVQAPALALDAPALMIACGLAMRSFD